MKCTDSIFTLYKSIDFFVQNGTDNVIIRHPFIFCQNSPIAFKSLCTIPFTNYRTLNIECLPCIYVVI